MLPCIEDGGDFGGGGCSLAVEMAGTPCCPGKTEHMHWLRQAGFTIAPTAPGGLGGKRLAHSRARFLAENENRSTEATGQHHDCVYVVRIVESIRWALGVSKSSMNPRLPSKQLINVPCIHQMILFHI